MAGCISATVRGSGLRVSGASSSSAWWPAAAMRQAVARPTAPAPATTTSTSQRFCFIGLAMQDSVQLRHDGAVAIITLDRPAKVNALDRPMLDRLIALLDEIARSGTVRAMVLT